MTAEFAAAMPAVLLALALCLGALQAVIQQMRLTDAAAEVARQLGRGESVDSSIGRVTQAVGPVSASTSHEGAFVCVRLAAPGPAGPLSLLNVTLSAHACALDGGR